jgi:Helicase HerA, central domain
MASGARAAEKTKVAGAGAMRPGDEAAADVLAQLDYGEAPHVGLLGDTGTGKTTAMQYLIALYLKKSPGSVFIVDDKELRARFAGQERRDVADLRARPIDPEAPNSRVIVFRGDPAKGQMVDVEEVCALAWARVAHGRKTLIVLDELIAGREEVLCKNTQWRKGITNTPRVFTAGRVVGIGTIWGAQSPQDVPKDPFEQSAAILTFRLAGLGLDRLRERNYLSGGAGDAIERLHGPPDPPAMRGDFAQLRRGRPWNGKIYKFTRGGTT